jgi:hypothetical protein
MVAAFVRVLIGGVDGLVLGGFGLPVRLQGAQLCFPTGVLAGVAANALGSWV